MLISAQDAFLPELEIEQMAVDQLGQLYLLETTGKLSVYNSLAQGTPFTFEDTRMGLPTTMDVSNPLGPLLYYADYQTVLLLDRTLHIRGQLDLRGHEQIRHPLCFARSFDDRMWVYDAWDYRLKLIDQEGELKRQSLDLRLRLEEENSPQQIRVVGELIFLLFPNARLATFNFMGHFLGWEKIEAADHYQWSQEGLIAWSRAAAWRWDGQSSQAIQLPSSAWEAQQLLPWKTGWLALKENRLFFYPSE